MFSYLMNQNFVVLDQTANAMFDVQQPEDLYEGDKLRRSTRVDQYV